VAFVNLPAPRTWLALTGRHVALGLFAFVVAGPVGPARAQSATLAEHELKAAFVFNFARYMRWPAPADADADAEAGKPFVIGLIGKDPFGAALDDVVRGQNVGGRAVVVRRFAGIDEVVNCDILFVGSSERGNLQAILAALRKAPVLTVSDMDRFAERGGMIGLFTEASRVRFAINADAIQRAGLTPGSQLLRLARIVAEPGTGK
jgi:hypothetical protein